MGKGLLHPDSRRVPGADLPQVWDLCHQKRAHWFVITSYEYWVFGCFTRGMILYVLRVTRALIHRSQDGLTLMCLQSWPITPGNLLSYNACSSGFLALSRTWPNRNMCGHYLWWVICSHVRQHSFGHNHRCSHTRVVGLRRLRKKVPSDDH